MKFLFFFITLFSLNLQAQEKKITDFLNKDLDWEVKHQFENADRIERFDTLVVVEPFKIKDGVLSIATKLKQTIILEDETYTETYVTVKQEVALNKIIELTKDINVIFVTQPGAVKTSKNGIETEPDSLFFLQLCCSAKYSEIWAKELLALFKKAGYTVKMENWYD